MSNLEKSTPEFKVEEIHIHNRKNKIKESTGYKVFTVVNTIIMILIAFATLYPFLYLVSQSFSSKEAIIAGHTSLIPKGFNIDTYIYVIKGQHNNYEFLRYYGNTILYTVIGTVLSLFFSCMLAYPLSKNKLKIVEGRYVNLFESEFFGLGDAALHLAYGADFSAEAHFGRETDLR